jgi:tetratricopeptide (TPR) repeat protein
VFLALGFAEPLRLAAGQETASPFAAAKEQIAQAEAEEKLASQAQANGDAEAMQKHVEAHAKLLGEGRRLYEAAGAATSHDPATLLDYAALLSGMEDFDLAEQAAQRAVLVDRENASAWLALGQAQLAQGPTRRANAIQSLKQAIEVQPSGDVAPLAHAMLGGLFIEIGLYDFARENLDKALELSPNHSGAKIALASLDLRDGQPAKASGALDSLGVAPELQVFMQHTLARALADFDNSRRWMPDTVENHLAYGKLLIRVGRLNDAVWPLKRALRLKSDDFVAWNLYGSVLREINQVEEARAAFQKSLEVNADQPRTRQVLQELQNVAAEATSKESSPEVSPSQPAPASVNQP